MQIQEQPRRRTLDRCFTWSTRARQRDSLMLSPHTLPGPAQRPRGLPSPQVLAGLAVAGAAALRDVAVAVAMVALTALRPGRLTCRLARLTGLLPSGGSGSALPGRTGAMRITGIQPPGPQGTQTAGPGAAPGR